MYNTNFSDIVDSLQVVAEGQIGTVYVGVE